MYDLIVSLFHSLFEQTGMPHFWWGNAVMILIGLAMVFVALIKKCEPFLLIGIGFACIVVNVPGSDLVLPGGLFNLAYQGVATLIVPPLIFLGVGALTDFGPMIANPKLVLLGAGAHLGIFVALILAKVLGFSLCESGAIGIIGGADGPMAIFVTMKLAPHLLPQISVAAYSYMALMPLIQPPVMRLLTTKKEREMSMAPVRKVSRLEKILFPLLIAGIVNLCFPPVAPLVTMLMLGNLLRETLIVDRLADTAGGTILNVITLVLTIAIGSTMRAETFLTMKTMEIVALGLIAFVFGTGSGVMTAKLMNLFLKGKNKINPLIGSAGIASVPIAARVSHIEALKANPKNFLIYHAMGPNLAGVFGTAISGGILLALLGGWVH
jgi:carboxybiotin decarboxylase